MTTKPWGGMTPTAGAWADHVEQEEENGGILGPDTQEFPSLGDAAKVPNKKEKKKPVKMSLNDFVKTGPVIDNTLMAKLPTAPRERSDSETRAGSGLGGGFKEYGGDRGARGDRGDRGMDRRRDDEASRADQVDNWGAERKFVPSDGRESRGFGGGGFGGGRDREERRSSRERESGPSAADDSSDWSTSKKFEPTSRGVEREGRSGYGDRRPTEYRSGRDEEDTWSRGRAYETSDPGRRGYGGSREPRPADAADRWSRREDHPPSGTSTASERPRLNLQPRTKPLDNPPVAAAAEADKAPAEQPKTEQPKKSNPFGAARPREEVLKEKGVDPLKEDLKLEHAEVQREETPQEVELKEQIEKIKIKLEVLQTNDSTDVEELESLKKEINEKEKQFLLLQAEEDSRVKYARAAHKPDRERPPPRGTSREKW